MPITPHYTWTETNGGLEVLIPLKGSKAAQADVFAAANYVKVSFAQYLLELDLVKEIDDHAIKAVAKDGNLILKLKKVEAGLWSTLTIKADRATLNARRAKAVEDRRERENKVHEQAKERKVEIERTTLRAQMAMEQAERQKLDDLKAEEKKRAEEEVYRTFSEMETKRLQEEEKKADDARAAAKAQVAQSKKVMGLEDIDEEEEEEEEQNGDGTGTFNQNQAYDEAEVVTAEEEIEARYIPGPRNLGAGGAEAKVKIGFTPRVFPTPMRESKRAEEEDWIARNRAHLHKNKTLTGELAGKDARDISEADPVWLKGKGDDFYRAGDFHAAVNAFSASLDVQPEQPKALSNRAACYLRLGQPAKCVEDCSRALHLAVLPDESSNDSTAVYANNTLRLRLRVRRGTAYVQLNDYEKALEDYRAALYHSSEDMALVLDLERIEVLAQCEAMKKEGDMKFGAGDLDGACERYSQAIHLDPTFVSCLSNRAASYMAKNDLPSALADCDQALQCLEEDQHNNVYGSIGAASAATAPPLSSNPPPGSEKRKAWALKTIVRRGVIRGALGHLNEARDDYKVALRLSPGDQALQKDLEVIEERIKAIGKEEASGSRNDSIATASTSSIPME